MKTTKVCFSTLGCCDRTLTDVIALAKRYGMDALEVRGLNGTMKNEEIADLSEENRERTVRMVAEAGLSLTVLGTSCAFHDPEKYEKAIDEGKRAIEIAARLGFSAIRVFGNVIKGDEAECIARVISGIRTLCRCAEGTEVNVLLEVHGDFNTEARLCAVAEGCGDLKPFGILWDVCHTRKTYGAEWRAFLDRFFPYIRHVHLKDAAGDKLVLIGAGDLPLSEMVAELTARGYAGYFSLEWEKKWHPDLPEIEEALERYRDLFIATPQIG